MRQIGRVIIHCSATRPSQDIGAETITAWHLANGWNTIGYHWVIRRGGDVERGRPESIAGAHVAGHNQDSIGICLIGGVSERGVPESNYTRAQWAALESLVRDIIGRYPGAKVSGHRDWTDAKACPCFDARAWWYGQA